MDLVQYSYSPLSLSNVNYNTDVEIVISAYNKGNGRGSKNFSRSFTTSSCPEIYGHLDFAYCGETIVFVFQSSVGCLR